MSTYLLYRGAAQTLSDSSSFALPRTHTAFCSYEQVKRVLTRAPAAGCQQLMSSLASGLMDLASLRWKHALSGRADQPFDTVTSVHFATGHILDTFDQYRTDDILAAVSLAC